MGRQAAPLLASLLLAGATAACVPPAPLSVSGALPPPSSTFALLGDDAVAQAARQPLTQALAARGLRAVTAGADRLVVVTLADRPRTSGAATGKALPVVGDDAQWVDRPTTGGLFAKGRREIRLTIRFLAPDGSLREERVAQEVVTRNAPLADVARLIRVALRP